MAGTKTITTDMPFTFFSMEAEKDYLLARMIHFFGASFHGRAGFFAQQACEKYMKALTVQASGSYLETHKLGLLADACIPIDPYFAEPSTRDVLRVFDMFDQLGRYGAGANFDPLAQKTPTFETAGVVYWHSNNLNLLDTFVGVVLKHLDFEKVRYRNGIAAVHQRDAKADIMNSWKGPVSLRSVLTRGNRVFLA